MPPGIEELRVLAMDLRWTWNHCSDALWRRLDPRLWELTKHPCEVLQAVSHERLSAALADEKFCAEIERLLRLRREALSAPAWFQQTHPESTLTCVAYFCMEFMLTEALPIYSGGLGNVAGDQLKAASDLGVPVVGVGLLYQHGYFRQVIDRSGAQQAIYPFSDPAQMPVVPVLLDNGERLRLEIPLPGGSIWVRAWSVQVGRVKLYLLDANDGVNAPRDRGITSGLYGGDGEVRLKQEILLGIAGWRLLKALGLRPEVCHLNEGHAAFVVLERARDFMQENKCSFAVALMATRAGNVFTSHTAVAAGFDLFSPALIEQYLSGYARDSLCISLSNLLTLGRRNPGDDREPFNMAYLAVNGSGSVNGVSELHGRVSRRLFAGLFPRWPEADVPIGHVTNGVHMPTWDSEAADTLWTEAGGRDRWKGLSPELEAKLRGVTDDKIWEMRSSNRMRLVTYARERIASEMTTRGAQAQEITTVQQLLKPRVLTLGFARRFATYKRPNLLLRDPARLVRLLTNPERPAQLILAGKAHPADLAGQALIQEWTRFVKLHEGRVPVMFLADYDMLLAEHLVQGVDVWINTPRRPWEASGTSGMKVLVNGGLNLSELDGWWAEAFAPDVGWALGDDRERGEDPAWDTAEAEALYKCLEEDVLPEFYARNERGLPIRWLKRVRESMARLTPRFSVTRTTREYTAQHYLPAEAAYRSRAAAGGDEARRLVEREREWLSKRATLFFEEVSVITDALVHTFTARIFMGAVSSTSILVELCADGTGTAKTERQPMVEESAEASMCLIHVYHACVSTARPASDYTARIITRQPGMNVPLEDNWILWQK